MSAENFDRSLAKVLIHEGGYVNHPADPGGETNKGVTYRVYYAYRQRKGLPIQSVRYISNAELSEIYRFQYWNNVLGDHLPAGVDYVVFDGAVNSGPKQSIIWLQQALGCVPDGAIGEATLNALEKCNDLRGLISNICARRMGFLQRLSTWGTFGKGWTARVSGVKATGLAMLENTQAPRLTAMPNSDKTAKPDKIDKPVAAEMVRDSAVGGSVLTEAANQLMPFQDYSNIIRFVVVGLVLLAVGAGIWAYWKRYRSEQAMSGEAMSDVPDFEELK